MVSSFPAMSIDRPSLQDPEAPERGYASYFKVEGLLAGDDEVGKKNDGFSNDFNRKKNKKYTMFFLSLVIGFSVHQS